MRGIKVHENVKKSKSVLWGVPTTVQCTNEAKYRSLVRLLDTLAFKIRAPTKYSSKIGFAVQDTLAY